MKVFHGTLLCKCECDCFETWKSLSSLHCISDSEDNIEHSNNRMLVFCTYIAHKYSQILKTCSLFLISLNIRYLYKLAEMRSNILMARPLDDRHVSSPTSSCLTWPNNFSCLAVSSFFDASLRHYCWQSIEQHKIHYDGCLPICHHPWRMAAAVTPVSYTHLTLPTNREV